MLFYAALLQRRDRLSTGDFWNLRNVYTSMCRNVTNSKLSLHKNSEANRRSVIRTEAVELLSNEPQNAVNFGKSAVHSVLLGGSYRARYSWNN